MSIINIPNDIDGEYVRYTSPLWQEVNAVLDNKWYNEYIKHNDESLCDMYSNELEMLLLFIKYSEGIIE